MHYLNINIFCYTDRLKSGPFKIHPVFFRGTEACIFEKSVKYPSYYKWKPWITDIKGSSGFQHSHRLIPELLLIRKVMICHAGYSKKVYSKKHPASCRVLSSFIVKRCKRGVNTSKTASNCSSLRRFAKLLKLQSFYRKSGQMAKSRRFICSFVTYSPSWNNA